jgi:hypothetical protein
MKIGENLILATHTSVYDQFQEAIVSDNISMDSFWKQSIDCGLITKELAF